MSKEIILYNQDSFSFKKKFYILIDLLITNQSSSRIDKIFRLDVLTNKYLDRI